MGKLIITERFYSNWMHTSKKRIATMLALMIATGMRSRRFETIFSMNHERALEMAKMLDIPEADVISRYDERMGSQDAVLSYTDGEFSVHYAADGASDTAKAVKTIMGIYSR